MTTLLALALTGDTLALPALDSASTSLLERSCCLRCVFDRFDTGVGDRDTDLSDRDPEDDSDSEALDDSFRRLAPA